MDKDLLRNLQMYDFAIQEAALYLNSHPNDRNALNYYQKVQSYSQELRQQYEQSSGPLTNRDNHTECWDYIHGKWPWEGGE